MIVKIVRIVEEGGLRREVRLAGRLKVSATASD